MLEPGDGRGLGLRDRDRSLFELYVFRSVLSLSLAVGL